MMKRKSSSRVLVWTAGSALGIMIWGACSHSGIHRKPASDGVFKTYTAHFNLFRYPDVPPLVRVFAGKSLTKITKLIITNPGSVVCQLGTPASLDVVPAPSPVYEIETTTDQDIYCFLAPNSKTAVQIQVDYQYSRNATAIPSGGSGNPQADDMKRTLRELESGQLTPETIGMLQMHGLVTPFTLFVTPGKPRANKGKEKDPAGTTGIATGDLLTISAVKGALGRTKREQEKMPFDASGLPAQAYVRPGQNEPVASLEVTPDGSYLFPNERPLQLICTTQYEDQKPKIVYRGGDAPLATRDASGNLKCQINTKANGSKNPVGSFTVEGSLVRYNDAIREFGGLIRLGDQGAGTREQQSEDDALGEVSKDVGGWINDDAVYTEIYNRTVEFYKQAAAAQIARHQHDAERTAPYFPPDQWITYQRGAFKFTFVPTKRSLPNSTGMVDWVDYRIQRTQTSYFPVRENDPPVLATENPFAPVQWLESRERWASVNQAPWDVVICPDKLVDAVAAVASLVNDYEHASRAGILAKLAPYSAANPHDCKKAPAESMYFHRKNRYIFVYNKSSISKLDGRDTRKIAVYSPDHIEALYESPNGARVANTYGRTNNDRAAKGYGLAFFEKMRSTGLAVEKASSLPPEVMVESNTLFPDVGSDGVMVGFPSF